MACDSWFVTRGWWSVQRLADRKVSHWLVAGGGQASADPPFAIKRKLTSRAGNPASLEGYAGTRSCPIQCITISPTDAGHPRGPQERLVRS